MRHPTEGLFLSAVFLTNFASGMIQIASTKARVEYDTRHRNQKGGDNDTGGFVVDCVRFAEHIWEYSVHHPTHDEYESSADWPLTVYEQPDSPNLADATREPL